MYWCRYGFNFSFDLWVGGVMDFEEWFKKRHLKTGLFEKTLIYEDDALYIKHEMSKSFKAGAASRQAELDELQEMYIQQGLTIAKLQKRIDDALDMLEGRKGKVLLDDIVETLKGELK